MKKFLTVFFVAIMVLSFSVTVFAADMPKGTTATTTKASLADQMSASGDYDTSQPAVHKFDRGVRNAATGYLEVPKRVVEKVQEYGDNPIKGLLLGLFQGACKAFAKTASGIVDIVTCPIGAYDAPAVIPDMPAAQ
ncbi:exosortase system-associated protein, TIGR04073 family [Candidatus Omnitrophota bacterium]